MIANNYMNGKTFYIINTNTGKVLEVRRKVTIGGVLKYIIENNGSIQYVTQTAFYQVPPGCNMSKIQ
jgi:hypothetical protein